MKTITFFDLDDTLITSEANVIIRNAETNEILSTITPGEYNTYENNDDEILDFSQFQCTQTLINTGKPIMNVIKVLQELHKIAKKSDSEVYLLTARRDFDDKEKFLEFLISQGIEAGHKDNQEVHVIRAGNLPGLDNASKKYQIINRMLKEDNFECVKLYDDSVANLETFMDIKLIHPSIDVQGFLIKEEQIVPFK